MSKPDAWMPLYVADYLADTTRLTTEQHGAYLLLIMDYWRNGPPPDDDVTLENITRLQPAAWKKNRPAMERMFSIEGGQWRHKRIDEELGRATGKYGQRVAAGKASAEKRKAAREAERNGNESSTTVERPLQRDTERTGRESQSQSQKDVNPSGSTTAQPTVAQPPDAAAASAPPDSLCSFRAAEIVALLKPRGVMTHSANPTVRSWAGRGVQDVQLLQALQTAESRRSERGSPQPVNVGLLNAILVELTASKPSPHSIPPASAFSAQPVAADGSGRPLAVPELDLEGIQ